MRGNYFLYIVAFLALAAAANANIFLGTCDGYVFDMSSSIISGANVAAAVSGCSGGAGNGCSGNVLSQSNGYYVIANLNLDPYGTVAASATAIVSGQSGSGSTSAAANEFQAARANITLCFPPSSPLLIDQGDSHFPNVTLYWNSGTDPFGYSTYDEFQLDSGSIANSTSPVSMNASYAGHTWKVRTCNTNGAVGCCSPFASDSFNIYNNAPLPPTLVHQNNTHSNAVTLYWTNGSDSDGDNIYHQFQIDSQPIQNNSFSPVSVSNLSFGSHTWRVRACDFMACSSWAEDTFSISNNPPSSPTLRVQGNTTNTTISLNWTSGTDPESDPVHDEFQFSTYYDFSINIASLSNATHPVSISNLSSFEKYYWRARSCDSQSCSAWASSSFVKYVCTSSNCTTNCTSNCTCNCTCPSCHCGGGGVSGNAGAIVQIILPSPPVEAALPISAGKPAANITYPEIVREEIKVISETPFEIKASWWDMLEHSWWKILILILLIIFVLILVWKRKEDDDEDERRNEKLLEELKLGHDGEPF